MSPNNAGADHGETQQLDRKVRDLTEELEYLRKCNSGLHTFIQAASDVYFSLDSRGLIQEVYPPNSPLLDRLGETPIGLIASRLFENPSVFHSFFEQTLKVDCKCTKFRAELNFLDSRIVEACLASVSKNRIFLFIRDLNRERTLAQKKYDSFYEQSLVGIASINSELQYIDVNEKLCEILGYSREELLQRKFIHITHPDDVEVDLELFGSLKTGKCYSRNKRYIRKDGRIVYAILSAYPIRREDQSLDHVISIIQDITEKKRAEDNLRENEERFRQIAENIDDVFWVMDKKLGLLYVSPAYEKIWGRSVRPLLRGYDWTKDIHPADRVRVQNSVEKGMSHGRFDHEYRIVRPDGEIRWIRDRGFPIRDPKTSRLYRIVGVAEDITKIKLVEKRLRDAHAKQEKRVAERTARLAELNYALKTEIQDRVRTQAQFKAVTDTVPGIITIHSGEKFRYVNRFAEMVTGYSSSELLNMYYWEVCTPKYQKIIRDRAGQRFDGQGVPSRYEIQVQRKDGVLRWIHLSVALIEYEGKPAILGTGYDITERKQGEAELQQAMRMADAANRAKSEFLANMSHEIRTPISAILGFAELLQLPGTGGVDQMNCVDAIQRNGRHLLELINDILDLSKIEAGEYRLEHRQVCLEEELSGVLSMFRQQAQKKKLSFEIRYQGEIPSYVSTDPTRLRQILINIVGNAIKFTLKGQIEIELRIRENKLLEFRVNDTGIGIAKKQQSDLFKPFSQLEHTFSRRFGGTGLGLTLARKHAQALGGNVWLAHSAPGEGSTFIVSIDPGPIDGMGRAQLKLKEVPKNVPTPKRWKEELKKVKILLVEDGPDNQVLFTRFLELAGAKVEHAVDGLSALQMALKRKFDVVLMDIQLPVLDGYQTTQKLRQNGYRKPILALTAHAMKDEGKRCLEAGCDDYLTKPISAEKLIQSVSKWVTRSNEKEMLPNKKVDRPALSQN